MRYGVSYCIDLGSLEDNRYIECKTITIGYYRDSFNNIMEIYTTKPGMLIGKAGANVEKLENMLSEEYRGVWKVKFIDIPIYKEQ